MVHRTLLAARNAGLPLIACAVLAACGGHAVRSEDPAAGGSLGTPVAAGGAAEGGAGGASAGGAAGVGGSACPAGLASAAEIAATPRADQNLELLALRLSTGIVADQDIYDRVVRDVTAIRTQSPDVAGIAYFPRQDGKSVELEPDAATFAAMQAGQYHAWDCLNQTYVLTNTALNATKPPFASTVELTLKGIYDTSAVAAEYGKLTGVKASPGGSGVGDGPTICVTRQAATWHYVFDQAGGDCPSGCTEHTFYHFTTTEDGSVTDLGQIADNGESPYTSNDACR